MGHCFVTNLPLGEPFVELFARGLGYRRGLLKLLLRVSASPTHALRHIFRNAAISRFIIGWHDDVRYSDAHRFNSFGQTSPFQIFVSRRSTLGTVVSNEYFHFFARDAKSEIV